MLNNNIYHTLGVYKSPSLGAGKIGLRFLLVSHAGYGNMYYAYACSNGLPALCSLLQERGGTLMARDYLGGLPGHLAGLSAGLPVGQGFVMDLDLIQKIGGTSRTWGKVAGYFKDCFPAYEINPILVCEGVVYDAPYLYVCGGVQCKFVPVMGNISGETCRWENGVFVYEVKKSGYVLEEGSKRHSAVELKECLYVNSKTGVATCFYSDVLNGRWFVKESAMFNKSTMSWDIRESEKHAILGFKSS